MSEQQPPAGTPEYLESGRGWAVPPGAPQSAARRRSRRTTWLVGGGVAALLALGAGAWAALNFFQQGPQPAVALPASTVAYVSLDLDPSGGQKIDAFRTLNKFPAFKDKVGIHTVDDVRRKLGEAIIGGLDCHLSYDADIAPWLGDRAAVAAVNLGNPNPDPVGVLQVTNDGKAQTGLHALTTCGGTGPSSAGYDVVDGWAVVAPTQELADQVVAETKRGSLADDATYQRWTKAVGDSGVVNLYAAPAAGDYLARQLTQLEHAFGGLGLTTPGYSFGESPAPLPNELSAAPSPATTSAYQSSLDITWDGSFARHLRNFQGAAATIRFTGDGLELATASDPSLSQADVTSDRGGAVVSRLPDDTAAALGVGLRPGWVGQLADTFGSYAGGGKPGRQLLDELGRKAGLDLPADLETLLGSSTALSVSKNLDVEAASNSANGQGVPVAVTVQGDPAAIEKVLAKLRAHDPGTAALGSDSSGDLVVLGPTASYRREILAGGHLGDSSAFRSVVPDAAHAGLVAYVNVDDLQKALSQVVGSDRQTLANIAPLRALGFSAWTDQGVARSSLKISTN